MVGKRKHSDCAEDMKKSVGRANIRFEFNSQTFAQVFAAFGALKTESEVLNNGDVTVTVTKKERLDNAFNFSMTEVAKTTSANVTVHIYPSTQSLKVQGKTGTIMNNHPFVSFTDIFLEPFLSRVIKEGGPEQDLGLDQGLEQNETTFKEEDATMARPPPLKKARVTKPRDGRNGEQLSERSMLSECQGGQRLISAYLTKKKAIKSEKKKTIVTMKVNNLENKDKIVKRKEVEAEKEKNMMLEKIMPTVPTLPSTPNMTNMPSVPFVLERIPSLDASYTPSGVDTIEYGTYLKSQTEIGNLNVKQRETRLKLANEKKKNARLGNEMKLLKERTLTLEDRIRFLENSLDKDNLTLCVDNARLEDRNRLLERTNTEYQQYHQVQSVSLYNEKLWTCKLQQRNSELKNKMEFIEREKCQSIQQLQIVELQQENSELKNKMELLERKNTKQEPVKALLETMKENNPLNESTQSNHDQTSSPYNKKTRTRQQINRQMKFIRQHIEGEHDEDKPKNIRAENLDGQKVVPLGPIMGMGEGERVYVTMDNVEFTRTGKADNKNGGKGLVVITGLQDNVMDENGGFGVAPVHLNGTAERMVDGRVKFKGEFYSPCLSQVQKINVSA